MSTFIDAESLLGYSGPKLKCLGVCYAFLGEVLSFKVEDEVSGLHRPASSLARALILVLRRWKVELRICRVAKGSLQ